MLKALPLCCLAHSYMVTFRKVGVVCCPERLGEACVYKEDSDPGFERCLPAPLTWASPSG